MHPNVEAWVRKRKREMRWEQDLHRYVTIGRRRDHLRAVWDAAKGLRVSRWLTPANAERVRDDCEERWKFGGRTLWVEKIGQASPSEAPAESSSTPSRGPNER